VTRGQVPQRAGLPGLNGGGAAAAVKVKQMIYIAVLCNSKITAEPLYNTPLVHWTLCRCQQYGAFSMKALARYLIILLGEQRHIRCEQLAQGCCPNNAAVGVEPATS